jgi:hypothetical protein
MMKGELKPKRKLQAIDQNTVYDVPARLTKLAREISDGKHGKVVDAVLAIRRVNENGSRKTTGYWYGKGAFSEAIVMLEIVKADLMGSSK